MRPVMSVEVMRCCLQGPAEEEDDEEMDGDDESGWETASDEEDALPSNAAGHEEAATSAGQACMHACASDAHAHAEESVAACEKLAMGIYQVWDGPARECYACMQAGEDAEPMWEEWDVRRSLFDGHVADSMEANLEYMWKRFGFYFPEADLLTDPEGLLKYLVRLYRIPSEIFAACRCILRLQPYSCICPTAPNLEISEGMHSSDHACTSALPVPA